MLRDVVLGAPAPAVANAAPPSAPVQQHGAFRVAAGAFRFPENAAAVRQQIERLGGHAEITRSGSLDLVTVGPFATGEAAEAEATRLRAANVDAVDSRQLLARLQRSGKEPFTVAAHGLTLVYIGPFETRQDAVAASERLRPAGFDGLVTRR